MKVNQAMYDYGNVRSAIRELYEFGKIQIAKYGSDNVYDYSLGNPSVPAPDCVNDTIKKLVDELDGIALHGYTSATGHENVRESIAANLNERFGTCINAGDIYMTCGAAASLAITLRALACEGDEFVAIAPFFPEYKVFTENAGAVLKVCEPDYEKFMINFDNLERVVNEHTKGIIINTPNNPTGVVYDEECLKNLVAFLERKAVEYGHHIILISDEPYRELIYDESIKLPYFTNIYDYTVVCYSFSKSLSLPGERIGYIVVSNKFEGYKEVYTAVCGAGRSLGYVCASSMFQRVVRDCLGQTSNLEVYKTNRDLLYNTLSEMGYECARPDGAFYLLIKSLEKDAKAFSERAKKHNLLIVPTDSFGMEGYIRLSYCVSTDMIKRSFKAFEALMNEYKIN